MEVVLVGNRRVEMERRRMVSEVDRDMRKRKIREKDEEEED